MSDLAQALEDAFDEHQDTEEEEEQSGTSSEADGDEESGAEEEAAADEDVADEDDDTADEDPDGEDEDDEEDDADEELGDDDSDDYEDDDDYADEVSAAAKLAPDSWTTAAKQDWEKIPETAQQTILKREQEVKDVLHTSAEARRVSEHFGKTVEPYIPAIKAMGYTNGYEAVDTALNTMNTLALGSPIAKAQIVFNLMKQFDVGVEALDSLLVGEAPAEGGGDVTAAVQAAVAPLKQQIETMSAAPQQQLDNSIAEELSAFAATHSFYDQLKGSMSHLMQAALANGQEMSLKQAYKQAADMHPEISKIMKGRMDKKRMANKKRKKKAASSVSGKKSGGGEGKRKAKNKEEDIRTDLLNAFDEAND